MTSTHKLPPGFVRSLRHAGSEADIELLQAGQLSRRMVQLRAILDLVGRNAPDAGHIAGLRDSFAALAMVQRHQPMVVARLLSGPQVGAWAAHCLRQLVRPTSQTPLWVHLAHLGCIVATAAIQSKVDFEARVPVRNGVVCFPGLGRALTERNEPWGLATCVPGAPTLLDGQSPASWQPIRLLTTDRGTIPLDNIDPYWRCFGLPVCATLDDDAVVGWQQQLTAALTVVAERHHSHLAPLTSAVRCLVPVERGERTGGMSASSQDAPGAVALTEPVGPDRLAATLVHEMQHFRLYALHDLMPLYRQANGVLYSPWRNDPREASGVLHGTMAFLGVADFWGREWPVTGRGAELTYARTVRQLRIGCRILDGSPDLTPAGRHLVATLTEAINQLSDLGISGEVRRIADDVVAHHRAAWRLRHVEPAPADVSRLAEAWSQGKAVTSPAASSERTTTTGRPGGDNPLSRLAVAWLENPDQVRRDATNTRAFDDRYPGAEPVDLPLLAGDYPRAQAVRLAQIAGGKADAWTWASLSVAHGRLCAEPAASPIATRPELARAAWSQVAGRVSLAELVSSYVAGTSTSDSMRR